VSQGAVKDCNQSRSGRGYGTVVIGIFTWEAPGLTSSQTVLFRAFRNA
jgi:hypothetical protein